MNKSTTNPLPITKTNTYSNDNIIPPILNSPPQTFYLTLSNQLEELSRNSINLASYKRFSYKKRYK
jgi:hypothetical protein